MINMIERITALRLERHWSEYQLAEKSGITQSTISSWARQNVVPTVPNLEKICTAFGITLSQFFLEDASEAVCLTEKQKEIYELFYQNDMSLSEIAAELDISRQAVRDQLKRTEKILSEYEEKLMLVEKFMANKNSAGRIRKLIDELENKNELSSESLVIAEEIRNAVDEIIE